MFYGQVHQVGLSTGKQASATGFEAFIPQIQSASGEAIAQTRLCRNSDPCAFDRNREELVTGKRTCEKRYRRVAAYLAGGVARAPLKRSPRGVLCALVVVDGCARAPGA